MMKRLLIQAVLLTGVGMCAFGQASPTQSYQRVDEHRVFNAYNPSAMPEVKPVNNTEEIKLGLAYLHAEAFLPIDKRKIATQRKRNMYVVRNALAQSDSLDSLASRHGEDDADRETSPLKKTVFLILSIITFIGMIVLLVAIGRKFR